MKIPRIPRISKLIGGVPDKARSFQWEADPGGKLDVPDELIDQVRLKATVTVNGGHPLVIYARGFDFESPGSPVLMMWDCLVNTSDTHMGITLKQRITYHEWMRFINSEVMLMPYKLKKSDDGKIIQEID